MCETGTSGTSSLPNHPPVLQCPTFLGPCFRPAVQERVSRKSTLLKQVLDLVVRIRPRFIPTENVLHVSHNQGAAMVVSSVHIASVDSSPAHIPVLSVICDLKVCPMHFPQPRPSTRQSWTLANTSCLDGTTVPIPKSGQWKHSNSSCSKPRAWDDAGSPHVPWVRKDAQQVPR